MTEVGNHTQEDQANPFQPKQVIKRTLYNSKRKESQQEQEYFPWGKGRGGGGEPFKDEFGNVITNRKAAIQFQQDKRRQERFQEETYSGQIRYQQQTNNIPHPVQQSFYQLNLITKEDPLIVENRRQLQHKYYLELQQQIRETSKIREKEAVKEQVKYGSPNKVNYQNTPQPSIQYKLDYTKQFDNPYKDLIPVHYPQNQTLYSKVNSQIDHEMSKLRLEMSNQTKNFADQIFSLKQASNLLRFENYDQRQQLEEQKINTLPRRILQITEIDLNGMRSQSNPRTRSHNNFQTIGQNIISNYNSNSNFSKPVDTLPIHSSSHPISYINDFNQHSINMLSNQVDKDTSFNVLNEIEQLNMRSEIDNSNYQAQTVQRIKQEKFFIDLDFKQNFPQTQQAIKMEKSHKEALKQLDKDLGRTDKKKDLIQELLEQSIVSHELYTARKDLNDFTYRAQNPSRLIKMEHQAKKDQYKQNIIPQLNLYQINPKTKSSQNSFKETASKQNDYLNKENLLNMPEIQNQSSINPTNESFKNDRTINSQFNQVVQLMNQDSLEQQHSQDEDIIFNQEQLDMGNQGYQMEPIQAQSPKIQTPKQEEKKKEYKLPSEEFKQKVQSQNQPKNDYKLPTESQEKKSIQPKIQSQNDYKLPTESNDSLKLLNKPLIEDHPVNEEQRTIEKYGAYKGEVKKSGEIIDDYE